MEFIKSTNTDGNSQHSITNIFSMQVFLHLIRQINTLLSVALLVVVVALYFL